MRDFHSLAFTLSVCATLFGCTQEPDLRIAAAADLRIVMPQLIEAFSIEHPEKRIEVVFGASGSFVPQIRADAPYHVFMSADEAYPKSLVESGHAAELTRYAKGRVTLFVRSDITLANKANYCTILNDTGVTRVAIADPAIAPYGRAAKAAIESCGLAAEITGKFVFGDNVSRAAQLAHSGAAQAAVISSTFATDTELNKAGRFIEISDDAYPPVIQAAVIVLNHDSNHAKLSKEWLLFITSETGKRVLVGNGLGDPHPNKNPGPKDPG